MLLNVKWGLIFGGVAFILAFVTSLTMGHTTLAVALIRGAGFLLVFSGLGFGIWALINTFLPELLVPNDDKDMVNSVFSMESPGQQINITVDDHTNVALPQDDHNSPDAEQVGDYADLASGGTISLIKDIDQSIENSYTSEDDFSPAFDSDTGGGGGSDFMDFGAFTGGGSFDSGIGNSDSGIGSSDGGMGGIGGAGGAGELDESDSMMDSFSFFPDDNNSGGGGAEPSVPERKVSGNKASKLEGDFDAKEIAQGLRTVLEKDKK